MSEPSEIVTRFVDSVSKTWDYHSELLLAINGKKRESVLASILSEQCVMSVAVKWEAFITDLMVAYVVLKPDKYMDSLRERAKLSMRDRFGSEFAKHVNFSLPDNLSSAKALSLIDPKSYNISHPTASDLTSKANNIIDGSYAIKFSFNVDTASFINYLISLRNFLAHRSPSARGALSKSISKLGGLNTHLNAPSGHIGTYLKGKSASGETRTSTVCRRTIETASALV